MNKVQSYLSIAATVLLFLTAGAVANEPASGAIHVEGWQWGMIAAFGLLLLKELIAAWRQRSTDESRRVKDIDLEKVDSTHCIEVRELCTAANDRRFSEGQRQFTEFRRENKASHNQLHAKVDEIAKLVARLGVK